MSNNVFEFSKEDFCKCFNQFAQKNNLPELELDESEKTKNVKILTNYSFKEIKRKKNVKQCSVAMQQASHLDCFNFYDLKGTKKKHHKNNFSAATIYNLEQGEALIKASQQLPNELLQPEPLQPVECVISPHINIDNYILCCVKRIHVNNEGKLATDFVLIVDKDNQIHVERDSSSIWQVIFYCLFFIFLLTF